MLQFGRRQTAKFVQSGDGRPNIIVQWMLTRQGIENCLCDWPPAQSWA
jgi:hypothetical protein